MKARALLLGLTFAVPPLLLAEAPKPTLANVAYGTHQRQVLDFYRASSDKPTPVVIHIHGGGWHHGDKSSFNDAAPFLAAGISVVTINYRFLTDAEAAKVMPPLKMPLLDAARAVQFVRSNAAEWNLDKARVGLTGSSAGACTSLWLAFHPDMADPHSSDPVARESTRPWCAAVVRAQTSLDPRQMFEWIPNIAYGPHVFGIKSGDGKRPAPFAEFLAKRDTLMPWIAEYSPYAHMSADDPPVYLFYDLVPAVGQRQGNPTHSPNFGVKLAEQCKSAGVECELVYPGAPGVKHESARQYLIEKLKAPTAR